MSYANSCPILIHNGFNKLYDIVNNNPNANKIVINEFKKSLDQKIQDIILSYDNFRTSGMRKMV